MGLFTRSGKPVLFPDGHATRPAAWQIAIHGVYEPRGTWHLLYGTYDDRAVALAKVRKLRREFPLVAFRLERVA